MRSPRLRSEAGFTLVELTIVVVISTIALIAIYQSLITQERTYRYQSAAIDTQGSTRVGLQVLASELREISASAGSDANMGGSDLLVATRDSIRFRAMRKVAIACSYDLLGNVDIWVPGAAFESSDSLVLFLEGDTTTDGDDRWVSGVSPATAGTSPIESTCRSEWSDYPVQRLTGLVTATPLMQRGALIRSYETLTYGIYRYDDEYVLGRTESDGSLVPLVGPLLPPENGGLVFRYFDLNGSEVTPTSAALRAQVARVNITVRALSRGGIEGQYVDSLSTNVYLRGN